MTEADLSNKNLGAGSTIIVGAWISHKDNGALVKLDISKNNICIEGTKAVAEALKGNQTMTELNISSTSSTWSHYENYHGNMSGVIAICDSIPTMGALQKLIMANNRMATKEGGKVLGQALAQNKVLKVLDISSNAWEYNCFNYVHADGPGFATGIADGIRNNWALTHLDISNQTFKNAVGETVGGIGAEGARAIAEALKSNVSGLTSGSTAVVY